MPKRAPRRCTAAGCPNHATDGRCPQHRHPPRRTQGKPRPSSYQQGYDAAWAELSKRIRRQRPICETPRCSEPSKHVDHIDGDNTNNEEWNLQALCHPCHSRKTAKHDGGFGNPRTPR
ncbi:HNH endonuclease signature motif containing protein [Nonomuraea sp. NPDC050310]|uniref:HNH endonuclease signature motif containing protein n=1 Tax=Nonomuraea sp. NPDC050310 TaxID=3154935 RepID=UPI00340485E0